MLNTRIKSIHPRLETSTVTSEVDVEEVYDVYPLIINKLAHD